MTARFTTSAPVLFAVATTVIYVTIWQLMGRLPDLPDPGFIAAAATFDLAVIVPGLYYILLVRKRGWPVISVVPVFLLSLFTATLLIPEAHHGTVDVLKLIVPVVELGVLGLIVVKGASVVRTYRQSSSDDAYNRIREAIQAALGRSVPADVMSYEVAVLRYALVGWKEKVSTNSSSFGYLRTSGYGPILLAILMAAVAEMIGGHFLLRMWSDTAAIVHLILVGYALVWFVGDYQAMRTRCLEVGDKVFRVRLGIRWDATIPTHNISGVRRLSVPPEKSSAYLNATPLGRPVYLIEMKRPVHVSGPYGFGRTVTQIGVAVDDEERFEKRLVEVLGAPNQNGTAACTR